jgi:predicted ATPase
MINSIELNNFKAFQQSGIVDMKKINILVGPNSSGKSSFIKSLLTLKNTMDSKDEEIVLDLNREIGTFKTIVFNNEINNKMVYSINFENKSTLTREDFRKIASRLIMFKITNNYTQEKSDNYNIDQILSKLMERSREFIVDNIKIEFNLTSLDRVFVENFHINFTNGDFAYIYKKENNYYINLKNEDINISNIIKPYKFYFKIDEDKLDCLEENQLEMIAILEFILDDIENRLSKFTDKLIYMEPLRNKIDRVEYVTNLKTVNTVGSKGENILTALLGINKMEKKTTKDRINYWIRDFDLGENFEVQKLGDDNYSILIKNKYTGVYNNILDVGVGTSQLLPIIIESVNSEDGSTLIIEEPETHIHPNAQSKLADLIVDCAEKQEKRFIIETHSIFLITQLQILVAQGKIAADDVKVYYFLQDQDGSRVMDMKLTRRGQFQEDWPSGFFDIHYKLGKKLFKYL